MNFRRISVLIGLMWLLSVSAFAQSSEAVRVRPEQAVYKVKQGSSFQVAVVIKIENGYHINSNRPDEDFLIPTALKIVALPGLRASTVRYPKAKLQKFSFSEKPMSVFDGEAILRFTARALPSLSPGNHKIKGKLTIQACNDQACLRPQTVDVEIPLEVSSL